MIQTLEQLDFKGKRVLMRVDFNVPLDKNRVVSDDSRIRAALPSIQYILEKGGKLILCSHLGRPDGKADPKYSLEPVAQKLAELLPENAIVLADDCIGEGVQKAAAELTSGRILLLENVRFYPEEEKNDDGFARQLASLCDIYVNDAFGTAHRAHASTAGVAKFVKQKAAGFLMNREIEFLSKLVQNSEKPYIAILGGSKVSDKIKVIESLLHNVSTLCIGGAMAFTFLAAKGISVGKSRVEKDKLDLAKTILEHAAQRGVEIILPVDHICASDLSGANKQTIANESIPDELMGLDIGPQTRILFGNAIRRARIVFWNGPAGLFELADFAAGTISIARAMAETTTAMTVVGGGDSAAAIAQAGYASKVSHVSTGGGASLEYIENPHLPGLLALE